MLRSEPDEKGRMHEGFMIDLLDHIAAKLKFDYVVYEVPDRKYGAEVEPGKWNGMVGELMHRDSEKVIILQVLCVGLLYYCCAMLISAPFWLKKIETQSCIETHCGVE